MVDHDSLKTCLGTQCRPTKTKLSATTRVLNQPHIDVGCCILPGVPSSAREAEVINELEQIFGEKAGV